MMTVVVFLQIHAWIRSGKRKKRYADGVVWGRETTGVECAYNRKEVNVQLMMLNTEEEEELQHYIQPVNQMSCLHGGFNQNDVVLVLHKKQVVDCGGDMTIYLIQMMSWNWYPSISALLKQYTTSYNLF